MSVRVAVSICSFRRSSSTGQSGAWSWRGFQSTGCGFEARLRHWILFYHLEVKESEMIDAEFVEKIRELADEAASVEQIDVEENQRVLISGGKVIATFANAVNVFSESVLSKLAGCLMARCMMRFQPKK